MVPFDVMKHICCFVCHDQWSSSNQIILFIVDVRVYLKFDLLEIVLHGIAGPGPFREHVHNSEDSLVSTWLKMIGRKSTMEKNRSNWFPGSLLSTWMKMIGRCLWWVNNGKRTTGVIRKMLLWFLFGPTRTHIVRNKDHSTFRFKHSALRKEYCLFKFPWTFEI